MNTTKAKNNWQGTDASLAISLLEYGLLVNDNNEPEKTVIYGIDNDGGKYTSFGVSSYSDKESNEVINESWFNKNSFLSFVGMDENEWKNSYLPSKIFDLLSYYGSENILGTSYHSQDLKSIKKNFKIKL